MINWKNWIYIQFRPTFLFLLRITPTKRLMYSCARGWKIIGLDPVE